MAPVFGDTYREAQRSNSKEDFIKSKEAASAATAWGSSLAGSALQTYAVGALINATGTLSYKGAAYLGGLVLLASSAPSVSLFFLHFILWCGGKPSHWELSLFSIYLSVERTFYLGIFSTDKTATHLRAPKKNLLLTRLTQLISQAVLEKRPLDQWAIGAASRVVESIGLSLFLTYWGTRTNPFD